MNQSSNPVGPSWFVDMCSCGRESAVLVQNYVLMQHRGDFRSTWVARIDRQVQ